MHVRKRLTISLLALAIALFVVGSVANFVVDKERIPSKEGYTDNYSLDPSSETSKIMTATKPDSTLNIVLNATDRLILKIGLNGELEYAKNESQLEHTFLLRNPGEWNITFRNDNNELVNYTCTFALTTYTAQTIYPGAWLIFPAFTGGEIALCFIIVVTFHDNVKKLKKTTKEIILFAVVAALALGFMPLLNMITRTNNPLMSPTSTSMEPTINPGDLAIVTGGDLRSFGVGDIIVYDKLADDLAMASPTQISSPTMHRISRIVMDDGNLFFVTKGDNNPNEDTWFVPEEGVIGKVTFVIPYLGGVVLALGQTEVKILILGVALGVIVLWPNKKPKPKLGVKGNEEKALSHH
jgi:signal peptidase I